MIEVSITEIALFAWATLATGYAYKWKHDTHKAQLFIRELLTNEKLYSDISKDFEEFLEQQNAN